MTSVFRKSTHTDQYLHFNSHYPQSHNQSVVYTLFSRAESLSSCPSLKSFKELHVSKVLQDNGYPERFIHSSCLPRPCPTSPSETEGLTTFTLPYLKGPSEAIQRVLQPLNIRTFFGPTSAGLSDKSCVTLRTLSQLTNKQELFTRFLVLIVPSRISDRQEELLHNV